MPKLSFVMPTHNRIEWMPLALQSLLAQSETDIEVVIVNDASTDGTKEFLEDWATRDPRVTVIHNSEPMGAGPSRNIGSNAAKADIIAVCDDDDVYINTRAAETIKWFERHPKSELVNFPYVAINYFEETTEAYNGFPFDHEAFKERGEISYFSNPTVAYRKQSAIEMGGYPKEKKETTDDYQFLANWIKAGKRVDFCQGDDSSQYNYVTMHRVLPDSMMSKMRGFDPAWLVAK